MIDWVPMRMIIWVIVALAVAAGSVPGSTLLVDNPPYSSNGSASYGHVSAAAIDPGQIFKVNVAYAGFDDLVTISGATGIGTLDYSVAFDFSGSPGGNGGFDVSYCFGTANCTESGMDYTLTLLETAIRTGIFNQQLSFTFGTPFHFAFGVGSVADGSTREGNSFASSQLDLQSLSIVCSSACPGNLTFTAASGTMYPFTNAAFVESPEPSTFMALAAGTALLTALQWFRRTAWLTISKRSWRKFCPLAQD